MTIEANALLRIADAKPLEGQDLRFAQLDDAILLHLRTGFAAEPEQLSERVEELLGPALAQHDDPRGILYIPDVAAPRSRSYDAVVAEVGEGGVWGPLPSANIDVLPASLDAATAQALL